MGVLEDILKTLDRVEIWKEVQNTPQRVTALEKRLGALEKKLGGKWPADVCRYCGERGARLNGVGHSRRCFLGGQISNASSAIMPIPITSTANATGS
jgi:hypothetical protein